MISQYLRLQNLPGEPSKSARFLRETGRSWRGRGGMLPTDHVLSRKATAGLEPALFVCTASYRTSKVRPRIQPPGIRMTGQIAQENKAMVLLRCEELQSDLKNTKERLNHAAAQLEELTSILLANKPSSFNLLSRPWLEELAFSQLIADVLEAERKLAQVRAVAAELGVPLPADMPRQI